MLIKKLSLITPLFNNIEASKAMLESLLMTIPINIQYEIILIDDASKDDTANWLNSINHPKIKTFINPVNIGYAKTNNIGVSYSSGDILVLINNDLIFTEGWLEPMLEILLKPELNAGIVGNIQRRVIDNEIDHAGVCVTDIGQVDHTRTLAENSELHYLRSFAVTGACLLIRKNDFLEVGCFDEAYINGVEDIDLCQKIKKQGKFIYLATNSVIQHHVSLSRDRSSIQNEINSRIFYKKWREEIKRELTKVWLNHLSNSNKESFYNKKLDGSLTQSFMASSNSAARIIAESFIAREEHRWGKLIDGVNPNDNLQTKCSFKGLRSIDQHTYISEHQSEVIVNDVSSMVNFYACGRRLDISNQDELAITIFVNDLQFKNFHLENVPNFNVGIINPLLMNGLPNVFKIKINFFDSKNNLLYGDASHLIFFSHFVIDDQMVQIH